MKKYLLLFALLLTTLAANAQGNMPRIIENAEKGTAYVTYKLDEYGRRLSNSYSGDVVIPEKSGSGYPVTSIDHQTFEGCVNLTSVKIPSTMKFIDYDAFRNCSLKEITIPASVDSIADGVFYNTPSLKKVVFEDGPSVLHFSCGQQYGGRGQFAVYNQGIEEVYIGRNHTTTWGSSGNLDSPLFKYSETIKKVTFGDGVKAVNPSAFFYCGNLETVVLGKGIQTIGVDAFRNCEKLTAINLPDGVERVEQDAFNGCKTATTLKLSSTLKYIGVSAFRSCESVTELTIPASVEDIDEGAFRYMDKIKKLTIADSTNPLDIDYGQLYGGEGMFWHQAIEEAYIGRNIISPSSLFRGNETLAKVTIGENVQSLVEKCFMYCNKLMFIWAKPAVPPTCNSETFFNIDKEKCYLSVPAASLDAYKKAEGWKDFFNIGTGIQSAETGLMVTDRYSVGGQRLRSAHKGLNIIRSSDGTTRKVVVR